MNAPIAAAARDAMNRGDNLAALDLWAEAIATRGNHAPIAWRLAQANVLLQLKRWREARSSFAEILDNSPDEFRARLGLARATLESRPVGDGFKSSRRELLDLLSHAAFDEHGDTGLRHRLNILVGMGEMALARAEISRCLAVAREPDTIKACLIAAGRCVPDGQRGWLHQDMLARLDAISGDRDAAATCLRLSMLLALHRYAEFISVFDRHISAINAQPDFETFAAVARRLKSSPLSVWEEPKVFGIGLSRTGTTSLCAALTMLGVDNGHWANPLTWQLLGEDDFYLLGGGGDTPVSARFEYLAETYPNARFVLTVRPLESWIRSMIAHWSRNRGYENFEEVRGSFENGFDLRHGMPAAHIHYGLYFRHTSYEAAYRNFHDRVRGYFVGERRRRLLEFDVFEGHGWSELCDFLERQPPDSPYPRTNAARIDASFKDGPHE